MQSVTMSNKVIDSTISNPCSLLLKARTVRNTPTRLHHRVFLSGEQQLLLSHKYPTGFNKPWISSKLLVKSQAYEAGRNPSDPNDPNPLHSERRIGSTPTEPIKSSTGDSKPLPPTTSERLVGGTPTEPIKPAAGDSKPLASTTSEPAIEKIPSEPIKKAAEAKPAPINRLKIGTYFVTWWGLNVIFNIYNKKVLNAYPFPWLTSTLSLAAGSALMFLSWATGLVTPPDTDIEFWKSLFPVALAHTIGHVAATVSMSKVAVSFTHIIKSSEPAFSVIIQRLLLGENFSLPVYLSLVPIIGGCGLAALTELNFNMTGFMGAMISNIAFVFRNIFSKKGMKAGKAVGGLNYYACLSIMSLVLLTPFALIVEPPQRWLSAWSPAVQSVGPQLFWWVVAQSVFYHLYNQVSYMSLDEISPLTFSIGNTMKRVTVIVSSILIFRTPVRPINAVGAAIAILGTFFYSQAKQ